MTYLQIAVEGGIPSLILYLALFGRGFSNLRKLRRRKDLDEHTTLLVGALYSSLIGFAVGAVFAPEAYQFFPYFAVAFVAALAATVAEQEGTPGPGNQGSSLHRFGDFRLNNRKPIAATLAR
jgi:O-antigen ligase